MRRFNAKVKKSFGRTRVNKSARYKAKIRAKQARRFRRTHR